MLECVINISEGQDKKVLQALADACNGSLLDLHTDEHHHRSVFTLGGEHVEDTARKLTETAVRLIDLTQHDGVHPRIGVVDVVPFVPIPGTPTTLLDAEHARERFAKWIGETLGVPAFLYGVKRSLPIVRKLAFNEISPDFGPSEPHPTAGACAVGARGVLVAYNLWLTSTDVPLAKKIAGNIRTTNLRALGLEVGGRAQVSCNLIDPEHNGPATAWDLIARHAQIERAELVGLIPEGVLHRQSPDRWDQLDISENKTIENRLAALQ